MKITQCHKDSELVLSDFIRVCVELGYDYKSIMSARRDAILVKKKIAVAKILREKGYSFPLIGRAMNKDHSTIIHYLRKKDD